MSSGVSAQPAASQPALSYAETSSTKAESDVTRDRAAAQKIQAEQSILGLFGAGAASDGKSIVDVIGQTAKAAVPESSASPSISKAYKYFESGAVSLAA